MSLRVKARAENSEARATRTSTLVLGQGVDRRPRAAGKPRRPHRGPGSRISVVRLRTLGLSRSRCCQWLTDARCRRTEARSTIWRPSSARFLRCTDRDVLRTRLLVAVRNTFIEIESDPILHADRGSNFGSVAVSMMSVAYGRQMPANGRQIDNPEAFQRQIFGMCRSGCA